MNSNDVTGLILAGGRASRMGGVDKGLEPLHGQALVGHVLSRLGPQVAGVLISANRNRERYAVFGWPVLADEAGDYAGPLAGIATGLRHCPTPWLVTAPCDTPGLPVDLVSRLGAALAAEKATVALAATRDPDGRQRTQPVFTLVATALLPDLEAWLASGERRVEAWLRRHRCAVVDFDDAAAFRGANTVAELRALS